MLSGDASALIFKVGLYHRGAAQNTKMLGLSQKPFKAVIPPKVGIPDTVYALNRGFLVKPAAGWLGVTECTFKTVPAQKLPNRARGIR